jgi:hypothetical protein
MRTRLVGHRVAPRNKRFDRLSTAKVRIISFKEIIMKNAFVRNPLSAITLAALALPALVQADCIPTAPVGYSVPFRMVSLESFGGGSNPVASYADGGLTYTAHDDFFRGTTLAGTKNQQLFSDRTYCRGTFLECDESQYRQPFDVEQAGEISISISDGENIIVFPAKGEQISVTFNSKDTYTGTCDSTSGELYLSTSEHMYVITFGTPVAPPPKPK